MSTVDLRNSTVVVLVRHGLPEIDGSIDPGLSELGLRQAVAVADHLVVDQPVAVYASHIRRAVETAAPLAQRLGLEVGIDRDLREWESYTPQPFYRPPEALEGSPRRLAFLEGRFEEFIPPHDHQALQGQMIDAMRRLGKAHPGGTAVAMSHGGAINAFLAYVTDTARTFFFDPAYTSVSRIRVMPDGRFVLLSVNETGHLRGVEAAPA